MILVSYFNGTDRRGMLAWYGHIEGDLVALGGFDPGTIPGNDPTTVVHSEGNTRVLRGWVHPDNIEEVSGQDGPGVEDITDEQGCSWTFGVKNR
jgi:hypothetical protein